MASVSRMFARNLLPSPSPLLAPLTNPAMSTISTVVGTIRCGCSISASLFRRSSGTVITPTLGSIVQNGKLAACAFALDKQLNRVDFPTFGSPTIPHCNAIIYILLFQIQYYSFEMQMYAILFEFALSKHENFLFQNIAVGTWSWRMNASPYLRRICSPLNSSIIL